MSDQDVVRAWRDAEYRASLSEVEQAALPAHPAGERRLTGEELGLVAGGNVPILRTNRYFPTCMPGTCSHTSWCCFIWG